MIRHSLTFFALTGRALLLSLFVIAAASATERPAAAGADTDAQTETPSKANTQSSTLSNTRADTRTKDKDKDKTGADTADLFPKTELTTFLNPVDIETIGAVAFTRCRVSDRQQINYLHAECGFVEVPEDYAAPAGKTIRIFVLRLRSSAKKPALTPLLAIDGGPGSGASDTLLFGSKKFLDKIRLQRDVFLVDQRGTGKSNALRCPELPDGMDRSDPETIAAIAESCLESFTSDPRLYTTSVAVRDYDRVRQALGLDQWDIYGISYGTRVALHYTRRFPDAVHTLVLDGVIHPELNLGIDVALESERALQQMLTRCRNSEDCVKAYPELEQGIEKLLTTLKPGITRTVENFSTGREETFTLTRQQLVGLIRLSLYSPVSATILPLVLHEAYANANFGPLVRRAIQMERATEAISAGMHASVVCTEDVAFTRTEQVDYAALERSYMGKEFFETLRRLCQSWPDGVRDEDLKQPLRSSTPTLLLSGSSDPITPPAYAEQVAAHLDEHQHIVVKDFGHGVATVGCMPTLIGRFLEKPEELPLDLACLDKLKPDPFFIDFNGPSP